MAYEKRIDGSYAPLQQRNIDVGIGLERNLMVLQGVDSVFATDVLRPIVEAIAAQATTTDTFATRVIADHLRAAVFVLAEGVRPGNTDQPYIARRLIRRASRYGRRMGIDKPFLAPLAETVIATLADAYPELKQAHAGIYAALDAEERRFQRTLARGEREFARAAASMRAEGNDVLAGQVAFHLYDTYGFPLELTEELAREHGLAVDRAGFEAAFAAHQAQSRQGAAGRFKGGLAERNLQTTKLHTATHLLHAALRHVLGPQVEQHRTNITTDRLRFDFSYGERLTPEQLAAVEALVNMQIARDLPVSWAEMRLAEARQRGALGLFEDRYGQTVKVYAIGDFSLEVCGGPHVRHTDELGHFRIVKEEAVAAGVRRIKAVLE